MKKGGNAFLFSIPFWLRAPDRRAEFLGDANGRHNFEYILELSDNRLKNPKKLHLTFDDL